MVDTLHINDTDEQEAAASFAFTSLLSPKALRLTRTIGLLYLAAEQFGALLLNPVKS